ncbi:Catenin alpha-2, partial [Anabarilius grahami]
FIFNSSRPQVTTLVNTSNKGPSSKKKGRSKKAHVLAVSVEQATQNFLEKGEQIAKDSQDLKEELIAAVEDVRKQEYKIPVSPGDYAKVFGAISSGVCMLFRAQPRLDTQKLTLLSLTDTSVGKICFSCNNGKNNKQIRSLFKVDIVTVPYVVPYIVEEALEAVKNATNEQDLANRFKEFGKEMVKLNYVAARRQQELKDPQCRDEMAAARGALKKNATMLYTASQAFLRHPDVAATRANRDYVFKQVQEAIGGISSAAQATSPTDEKHGHAGIGELAAALNEFDRPACPLPPQLVLLDQTNHWPTMVSQKGRCKWLDAYDFWKRKRSWRCETGVKCGDVPLMSLFLPELLHFS